jgi:uncharacterized membrane protein
MTSVDPREPDDQQRSAAEIEVRALAVERLTFFADAVIAIAITLLALDLTVPSGATNAAFWHSALAHSEDYLAFVISFLVIAAHWGAHHRMFRYVTYLDGRLAGLTMAWLFTQIVTPFATRVITGDGAFQLRFGFYAVVQLASFGLFTLMVREVQRKRLYRDNMPAGTFGRVYLSEIGMAFGFLISIPVSFFTPWAYACWFAGPLSMRLYRRVHGDDG